MGSPPLTRGILYVDSVEKDHIRFTPAHAGNTKYSNTMMVLNEVHPRSRGEYFNNSLWNISH